MTGNWQHIVITGGNSGLGAALARELARPGRRLSLFGRHAGRLEEVAFACRSAGAEVVVKALDVTDADGMKAALMAADGEKAVDLVIANAGISAGLGGQAQEDRSQVAAIFATNIDGVVNTVQPLLPALIARKAGQIAIISSLAGIRGLPSSPAYSASKSAVRVYAEGLRGALMRHGVKVNAVCPGFIRTPMTDVNPYHMPFIMEAEEAARRIIRGLARNQARIAFPRRLYWPLWLAACLPTGWTDRFFSNLPAKPAVTETSQN